jgi:hypothetical protein
MVGAIILGERNFVEYTGKSFPYEWDCCWRGWSLAQLNPTLLEQKDLLQHATDNVASFAFEGCISRTKAQSHPNDKHEWQEHMLTRPKWLPGLDQAKHEKERLKKLYRETMEVYSKIAPEGKQNDSRTMEASIAAVKYYAEHVHGAALVHSKEAIGQTELPLLQSAKDVRLVSDIPSRPHDGLSGFESVSSSRLPQASPQATPVLQIQQVTESDEQRQSARDSDNVSSFLPPVHFSNG